MSRGISVSSMCNVMIPKSLSKKYNPLLELISDDVVVSRAKSKFSPTPFL